MDRVFTPEEAKAIVPRLRPLLAALRDAFHGWRFVREQLDELEAFGQRDDPDAQRLRGEAAELGARVDALLAEIRTLGADVKDPLLGLVDLPAMRDGKLVLLCYRDDEETLGHWHPIETGFAGRRPLSEF